MTHVNLFFAYIDNLNSNAPTKLEQPPKSATRKEDIKGVDTLFTFKHYSERGQAYIEK